MVPRAMFLMCLALLAFPPLATSQEVAIPASAYALSNARVVVAPGNVIERGTVIIRDGRILDVGSGVNAPADAVRLHLEGMTLYPGMVEVANTTGLPKIEEREFGGGGPRVPFRGDGPRPEIQPFRMAAEVFNGSDDDLDTLRKAGVTTVGLTFQGGLFPGQTAAMSTGVGPRTSQMLRTPVSMQVGLNGTESGYPSTVMGAMAYIEQSWEDTRYDMRVQQAFERDPTSAPRPQFDPEHEALIPAVTGEMPVWFAAASQREFSRVAALASRLDVTDYVFLGGQEGYLATDLLSRLGRPVIVSLDFPDPDDVTGRAFAYHVVPVSGDDTVDEQADSATARAARGNAAALVAAGISVTLSSYGTDVTEFRSLIGSVVEAGLSEDEALRAVTITPATLLGLRGAIGTIERGKLANLLVTDGDLFNDDTHVLHVFVEGQRFDYPPEDEAEADGDGNNRRGRRGGGGR